MESQHQKVGHNNVIFIDCESCKHSECSQMLAAISTIITVFPACSVTQTLVQVDSEEVARKLPPPLIGRTCFLLAWSNTVNSLSKSYLL